ncbi:hypothetical protein LMG7053_00800 [Achromobacter ruhlandii]|uniref:Uncharacterized protein n=1 Tax=Achromobacter ruhlandii TaxID=72557 RepID=A0ABM8LP92_9BURK|nr:hypothetical protein Axylo_4778 [Achromobacter xylosoxidans]CAB3940786.1 hypothetical protein LMG7053_00800 [Achromobacter ruhlandii]
MMERPLSELLQRCRSDITTANIRGNVEGLLARHIVGGDPRLEVTWDVDCDENWLQKSYDPSSLPSVAALGYTATYQSGLRYGTLLEEGLQRASARDPSIARQGDALHDPAVLIGLILAARMLHNGNPQYLAWCARAVSAIASAATVRIDPLLAYAAQLAGARIGRPHFDLHAPLDYCAAVDWWCDHAEAEPFLNVQQRQNLRAALVERALAEFTGHRSAHQAALLWRALRAAVADGSGSLLQSTSTVTHILGQFESSLRRWRWDSADLKVPVNWLIRSEREVQDILWIILRSMFPDLEDEDTLPKFGHSTYRADLGIPSLGLLIEVKFARSATEFKEIEKQVLEDIVPYLRSPERYRQVLVFIYDDSCSVQEHETTRHALITVPGVADVLIVSRPSHLPQSSDRTAWEKATVSVAVQGADASPQVRSKRKKTDG